MPEQRRVAVVLARCQKRKTGAFGIRLEAHGSGQWVGDWAFPIDESRAKREGFDRTPIDGEFSFADAYPGCPWCEAGSMALCTCDKVLCWDGRAESITCPWCGKTQRIQGEIDTLCAGGDR